MNAETLHALVLESPLSDVDKKKVEKAIAEKGYEAGCKAFDKFLSAEIIRRGEAYDDTIERLAETEKKLEALFAENEQQIEAQLEKALKAAEGDFDAKREAWDEYYSALKDRYKRNVAQTRDALTEALAQAS